MPVKSVNAGSTRVNAECRILNALQRETVIRDQKRKFLESFPQQFWGFSRQSTRYRHCACARRYVHARPAHRGLSGTPLEALSSSAISAPRSGRPRSAGRRGAGARIRGICRERRGSQWTRGARIVPNSPVRRARHRAASVGRQFRGDRGEVAAVQSRDSRHTVVRSRGGQQATDRPHTTVHRR
jgi:hypothetical protein